MVITTLPEWTRDMDMPKGFSRGSREPPLTHAGDAAVSVQLSRVSQRVQRPAVRAWPMKIVSSDKAVRTTGPNASCGQAGDTQQAEGERRAPKVVRVHSAAQARGVPS